MRCYGRTIRFPRHTKFLLGFCLILFCVCGPLFSAPSDGVTASYRSYPLRFYEDTTWFHGKVVAHIGTLTISLNGRPIHHPMMVGFNINGSIPVVGPVKNSNGVYEERTINSTFWAVTTVGSNPPTILGVNSNGNVNYIKLWSESGNPNVQTIDSELYLVLDYDIEALQRGASYSLQQDLGGFSLITSTNGSIPSSGEIGNDKYPQIQTPGSTELVGPSTGSGSGSGGSGIFGDGSTTTNVSLTFTDPRPSFTLDPSYSVQKEVTVAQITTDYAPLSINITFTPYTTVDFRFQGIRDFPYSLYFDREQVQPGVPIEKLLSATQTDVPIGISVQDVQMAPAGTYSSTIKVEIAPSQL